MCDLRGVVQQRGSPGETPSEASHLNHGGSAGLDDGLRCEIERDYGAAGQFSVDMGYVRRASGSRGRS